MKEYAVIKLREMACSNNSDIEELLRRAKTIAYLLDITEMVSWCNNELNGYPSKSSLPEYRLVKGAKIFSKNIHTGKIVETNLGAISFKRDAASVKVYNHLTDVSLRDSVSTLKNYLEINSPYLSIPLSSLLQQVFKSMYAEGAVKVFAPAMGVQNLNKEQEDFLRQQASACFENFYYIPSGSIFSSIRDTVLNYALELEKNNILGENLRFSLTEKEKAMNSMIINNTNNFHGNVQNTGAIGAGNSGDISQTNSFQEAKWKNLKNELEKLTVSSDDIQILRNELQNTSAPQTEDDISRNIWKWLGRVGAKVSEPLLYSAISSYLGIPISP